ncbi:MAG: Uncharacterised protein [Hyphomonas sp. TMED17]|nr:MAG: Uncharacterised protein [Hyphomonas sp. TMED17]
MSCAAIDPHQTPATTRMQRYDGTRGNSRASNVCDRHACAAGGLSCCFDSWRGRSDLRHYRRRARPDPLADPAQPTQPDSRLDGKPGSDFSTPLCINGGNTRTLKGCRRPPRDGRAAASEYQRWHGLCRNYCGRTARRFNRHCRRNCRDNDANRSANHAAARLRSKACDRNDRSIRHARADYSAIYCSDFTG